MQFTISTGQTYDIRFMYDQMPDGTVLTTCTISHVDPHITSGPTKYRAVALGEARQSVHDTFNKEIGRRIALSRATQDFPKQNRRLAWEAYFNRKPNLATTYQKMVHQLVVDCGGNDDLLDLALDGLRRDVRREAGM